MEATSASTQALSRTTFACKLCESAFTSADELRRHLRKHISKVATDRDREKRRSPRPPPSEPTEQSAPLPAPEAPGSDEGTSSVPDGSLASFKCAVEGCQYTTDNGESLAEHLRSHHKTSDCGCPFCGEAFDGITALVQHIVASHQQRPFQCGFCNYSASQPLYVVLHCRFYHGELGRLAMKWKNAEVRCHELTPQPPKRADRSVVPYRCSVNDCGFKTVDPDTFKLHYTDIHPNLEKFDCFVCDASTSSPKALLEHFLEHNLGAVICGLCQHYELSSLKAMLKHHCDYHPDGSLQILFRNRRLVAKFERFVAEFGRMARYLPPQPPSVQESGPRRSSRLASLPPKRYLPPSDSCSDDEEAMDSCSVHNCKFCVDFRAPNQRTSLYPPPKKQCRPARQSHQQALYVIMQDQVQRVPLSTFTQHYNIEARVVVKGSERCLASQYLHALHLDESKLGGQDLDVRS